MPECHLSLPPIEFQALPESNYIRAEKEEQYRSVKGSPLTPLTKPYPSSFCLQMRGGGQLSRKAARGHLCLSKCVESGRRDGAREEFALAIPPSVTVGRVGGRGGGQDDRRSLAEQMKHLLSREQTLGTGCTSIWKPQTLGTEQHVLEGRQKTAPSYWDYQLALRPPFR